MSHPITTLADRVTNFLHEYGSCSPADFVALSRGFDVSDSRRSWCRAVALRLIASDCSTLAEVPRDELAIVLARDSSPAMEASLLLEANVVTDLFGDLSSDELRAVARRSTVHESLQADLLRWAANLEWSRFPTLSAVPPSARIAVTS